MQLFKPNGPMVYLNAPHIKKVCSSSLPVVTRTFDSKQISRIQDMDVP